MNPKTFVQAACRAVSNPPGAAHVTSLVGHLSDRLKCSLCSKEYTVDYDPNDLNRIADFENKLRLAAQRAIDKYHPLHSIYVNVHLSC